MTCTIELTEYVDGLTVNTEWTGPDGFSLTEMAQRKGSSTIYMSTAIVNSFGRDQSGEYTCSTNVRSTSGTIMISSTLSKSITVTVGKPVIGNACCIFFIVLKIQLQYSVVCMYTVVQV